MSLNDEERLPIRPQRCATTPRPPILVKFLSDNFPIAHLNKHPNLTLDGQADDALNCCRNLHLMESDPIQELQDVIKATHGCDSKHVMPVPIRETFGGQTEWEGTVEVFDLIGHAKAKRCYAWRYRDRNEIKAVAVLELPPVNCALSAVKAAITPGLYESRLVAISQTGYD